VVINFKQQEFVMPLPLRLLTCIIFLSGIVASATPSAAGVATTTTDLSRLESNTPTQERHSCSSGNVPNGLQKNLLITAFPRSKPLDSSAGALEAVEQLLPHYIAEQLQQQRISLSPQELSQGLPSPDISSEALLAEQAAKLADSHSSQLLLSGEILEHSMAHPELTYNPGLYQRFINGVLDSTHIKARFDRRTRVFSFRLNLRDGFTGQSLFSKTYRTYGLWGQTKNTGFGTPLFWQSDYGQQIKGLIKVAVKELGAVIECQPFLAKIESRPGQTQIVLRGGANNGLHAGDTLELYQRLVQGSDTQYAQGFVRLVERNATIELREVYPSHSIGQIKSANYPTGQLLGLVP